MKIPNIFIPEKDLEDKTERLLKEPAKAQPRYEVIYAVTFAEGIAKLKKEGQKPFTFSENVEARIADYKANGEDAGLFRIYFNSVTGIAYKANSTKFKLILKSEKLENILQEFKQDYIPIDYNTEKGIELDSKKGKYGQDLTREEAKNHKFWLEVMGGDKGKLVEYVDILFDKTRAREGMGVYIRRKTSQDELWALVIREGGYGVNSFADGEYDLDNIAKFISGAK